MRLLEQIETEALSLLPVFNCQNCANLLWGFAKLRYTPTQLLQPMGAKLTDPSFQKQLKPVEVCPPPSTLPHRAKHSHRRALTPHRATHSHRRALTPRRPAHSLRRRCRTALPTRLPIRSAGH